MKNLAQTSDYKKFRNTKSLAAMLAQIHESFFEGVLFYLLAFFCVSPMVMVALLNLGITFFNPYLLVLQIGYISVIFTILLAYKRFCEKPLKASKKIWAMSNLQFIFLGALLFWAILSTLFSSNMLMSFIGDYYRREGLLTMGAYAGIFTGVLSVHSEKLKNRIITVFVLAAAVVGVVVIFQYWGLPIKSIVYQFGINDEKTFVLWAGTFHNINHYGYFLSMAVMAAGGLFLFENRKVWLVLYGLSFIVLAGVLVANDTFGSYLGVLFGLMALTGVSIYRKEKVKQVLVLLVLFFAVSLFINGAMGTVKTNFTILAGDVEKIRESSSEIATTEAVESAKKAGSGRWKLWGGAFKIIEQNPLFGTGPDNMATAYRELGRQVDRPHNEFLQMGASLGIPALIFYCLALGFGYGKAFKHLKKLSPTTIIAFGACTGYLISSLFGNTMYYTYPYFLVFLAIAFSGTRMEVSNEPHQKIPV